MIVLDTHVWLFWTNDSIDQLSKRALKTIQSQDTLGVSVISCWEIAMLVAKERLRLTLDIQLWVNQALLYPKIKLLPLDADIAVSATRLPGQFHGDPADRMIVATCLRHNLPLISKDDRIRSWGNVNVIW
ncbi:type II toxin-antitoxin system VapC family toxin [candidate division KSB1 bacterium]|nr:type II toxin-antitoxin system VapC family toxin [candidate division KSB1 bacterium]